MKYSDEVAVCMLHIEATDEKNAVLQAISDQRKPVILVVPAPTPGLPHSCMFGRYEDYNTLKHARRQQNLPDVVFVSSSPLLRQLAQRNGFPAYPSLDEALLSKEECQLAGSRYPAFAEEATHATLAGNGNGTSGHNIPLPPLYQATPITQAAFTPSHVQSKRIRLPLLVRISLAILLLLAVGGVVAYFFTAHTGSAASTTGTGTTPLPGPVGKVYFLSSEQVNENSNQGIDDEVQVDLHTLPASVPGKSYYAWLLPDKSHGDASAFMLGQLAVSNGIARLLYSGDFQHTNLLASYSRFLITAENAAVTPIAPSLDASAWRYYAEIPQVAASSTGTDASARKYSFLDHLRHLLVSDPSLSAMDLPGGLNNWLYRNTGKLLEWAESARDFDGADPQFLRRQIIRVLAYLDGLTFVQQDLPPGTFIPLTTRFVRMGLIDVQQNQHTPSYLSHIVFHLNGLLSSPGTTPEQRIRAAGILTALNTVNAWLRQMRKDARQLMAMTDEQLFGASAHTLYNDMVLMARAANDGQIDPAFAQVQEGVVWVHTTMQGLATFEVRPYSGS